MLTLFYNRRGSTYGAVGLDELGGFDEASASLALVSTCLLVAAVGTCSLHESVGQESVTLGTVRQLGFLSEDVPVIVYFH